MIRFTTIPLRYEGTLGNACFSVPESPSTEDFLNSHATLWKGTRVGSIDPDFELYNFVADRWPFLNLESRSSKSYRAQLPLVFSLS